MNVREKLLQLVIDHPELLDFVTDSALSLLVEQHPRQKVEIKSA